MKHSYFAFAAVMAVLVLLSACANPNAPAAAQVVAGLNAGVSATVTGCKTVVPAADAVATGVAAANGSATTQKDVATGEQVVNNGCTVAVGVQANLPLIDTIVATIVGWFQ